MRILLLVLAGLVITTTGADAQRRRIDYKEICERFECRNKHGEMCRSQLELLSRNRRCQEYDSEFGYIRVHDRIGEACLITDDSRTGWIFCASLQYASPLRR